MRGVCADANASLAEIFERLRKAGDPEVTIHHDPDIKPGPWPTLLDGAEIGVIDHTALPTYVAKQCKGLKHVVFLGTGARSYMNPEELAALGIEVHLIKGYGDTAVAECAIALMWASARVLAQMDREMRVGNWLREDAMQLTGKTLGLIGFGGIAAEVARIAAGSRHEGDRLEQVAEDASGFCAVRLELDTLLKPRASGLDPSAAQRRDPRLPFARKNRARCARA